MDEFNEGVALALKRLAKRDYTCSELSNAGVSSDVIDHLVRRGFVDDRRVAEQVLAKYGSKYGRDALETRLKNRGIPEEVVLEVLSSHAGSARQVLAAKFPQGYRRDQAARFLTSRGFAEEEIESELGDS